MLPAQQRQGCTPKQAILHRDPMYPFVMLTPHPIISSCSNSEGRWWSNNSACCGWKFAQNSSKLLAFESTSLCPVSLSNSERICSKGSSLLISNLGQLFPFPGCCICLWCHTRLGVQRHSSPYPGGLQAPKTLWLATVQHQKCSDLGCKPNPRKKTNTGEHTGKLIPTDIHNWMPRATPCWHLDKYYLIFISHS